MFLPVRAGADFGQVRVSALRLIPAVTQQFNVNRALCAIANGKVFLVVDIVGTEARSL